MIVTAWFLGGAWVASLAHYALALWINSRYPAPLAPVPAASDDCVTEAFWTLR